MLAYYMEQSCLPVLPLSLRNGRSSPVQLTRTGSNLSSACVSEHAADTCVLKAQPKQTETSISAGASAKSKFGDCRG
jgi:hypothetical protein